MTTISAKTILRSRNAAAPDKILSTLLLRYPCFIHAEFMTHRAFSRNAASSRAIPVKKIIDDILADTAMPIHWGKNQKGMQAAEECDTMIGLYTGPEHGGNGVWPYSREMAWLKARDQAIEIARAFDAAGYHKQVVNRLLEPFMHITVLVSATEWSNFLELRDHPDAEPHIQMLAHDIRRELEDDSTIKTLHPGEWHLPFLSEEERIWLEDDLKAAKKLSVARCASTSYKTVDGFDMDLDRAVWIYDKLVTSKPIHASPLEHVAQVDDWNGYATTPKPYGWQRPDQHGNFVGFRQLRHMVG